MRTNFDDAIAQASANQSPYQAAKILFAAIAHRIGLANSSRDHDEVDAIAKDMHDNAHTYASAIAPRGPGESDKADQQTAATQATLGAGFRPQGPQPPTATYASGGGVVVDNGRPVNDLPPGENPGQFTGPIVDPTTVTQTGVKDAVNESAPAHAVPAADGPYQPNLHPENGQENDAERQARLDATRGQPVPPAVA